MLTPSTDLHFRTEVLPTDPQTVRQIVESTQFFYPHEVDVAVELVDEHLAKGPDSGYHFVFAHLGQHVVAYACYGPIPVTNGSFDLYWIATHSQYRGRGIGKQLLEHTCTLAQQMGARALYAETSGRPLYEPTRQFYLQTHFTVDALQRQFYDVDDDKWVFRRLL